MKGLKRIALVSAIAAAPFAAQAELKALDDTAMGNVTGQAGVTIDLSANVSVEEIAYEDQGFLVINGLKLGGHSGLVGDGTTGIADALDDIRLTVDVAGSDPTADLGFDGLAGDYLGTYNGGAVQGDYTVTLPDGTTETRSIETDMAITDGDLVIALRSQSGNPVDFGLAIGAVSLAKEAGNADNIGNLAASNPESTVLISDMQINGYLGPIDVVVHEESNQMNINAYFNANGSVTMPFMGTSLEFELHNRRGESTVVIPGATDPTTGKEMSFAHAQVEIGVEEDYQGFSDGATGDALRVDVQDFSGDLDVKNIMMGNDKSIGNLYLTDLRVSAQTVIYGHGTSTP